VQYLAHSASFHSDDEIAPSKPRIKHLDIPESVVLRTDVSLAECEGVMEKAMASIIPLIDNSTGAGHMMVVTSLHYGTPVIATNIPVLTDYIIEGKKAAL
jgi:glycosyltransferase involved in cell wall biosynthesis